MKNVKRKNVEFCKNDLSKLSELHPPSFMPNGNVGTSLKSFISLIRSCQLPPNVIKKLGLSFPTGRSKHCYGNVRFDYCDKANESGVSLSENLVQETNHDCKSELANTGMTSHKYTSSSTLSKVNDKNVSTFEKITCTSDTTNEDPDELISDTESEPEEEWERHEALHDDVDCQGRTKERLFENKIELKWEKGGSGLVFYTDAAYWDSLNGDFDEQTADDWDIDVNIYEKNGEFLQYHLQSFITGLNKPKNIHFHRLWG